MATKPRYLKTPVQLWIADNRLGLGLTPRDIADLTGVSESTARGWESRGRPSQEALAILERQFGEKAPDEPDENYAELAEALGGVTAAIRDLVAEMREDRARGQDAAAAILQAAAALGRLPTSEGDTASRARPVPDGSRG